MGSTLVMQVNGINANEFDTITASGNVVIDGVLKILVNPTSSIVGPTPAAVPNPVYTPTMGDEITIITVSAASLPTDFNDSGSVDGADFTIFKNAFGEPANAAGDADADGDTDGSDFLSWQRDFGKTALQGSSAARLTRS